MKNTKEKIEALEKEMAAMHPSFSNYKELYAQLSELKKEYRLESMEHRLELLEAKVLDLEDSVRASDNIITNLEQRMYRY